MVRAFEPTPLDPAQLDRLLDAGRRAPSAGFSQGTHFVVLEGPAETARLWDATLPSAERARFAWPRLLDAPVIVLPLADPDAYTARYAEPDKAASGLADATRWPVPYWEIDAAMAVMLVVLAAHAEGLGALLFGVFRGEDELRAALGIPERMVLLGAIALGWPTSRDRTGSVTTRPRRPLTDVVHRGGW